MDSIRLLAKDVSQADPTNTSRFWRAWVETRNFEFQAYGRSLEEALLALRRGWVAHVAETGAMMTWEDDILPDVSFVTHDLGQAYRDGEPIGAAGRAIEEVQVTDLQVAEAVLLWAETPGDHGGNPYCKPFVRLAQKALGRS